MRTLHCCRFILASLLLIIFMPLISLADSAVATSPATAIFAGGCFWSAQHDLEKVPGVIKVISGYTGGHVDNPTYEQVSSGSTGHYESVKVYYDPKIISYPQLLMAYWHDIDPTDTEGQFCDNGDQYRSVIFYKNDQEKSQAEASKNELLSSGKFTDIATQILPASTFYPAEDYHQEYATKNPIQYNAYRYGCGRDKRLEEVWGK